MAPPKTAKIIAGSVAAAVTLTAGAAIASEVTSTDEPELDDVVLIRDVEPPTFTGEDLVADPAESVSSPFDTVSVESVESVESMESPESPESVSVESMESVSVESTESVSVESVSVDSPESVESVSVDSPESPDSVSVDSPESVDSP